MTVATATTFERSPSAIPDAEWALLEPTIAEISRLKIERDAIVLAHNYMTPEIFHCVADMSAAIPWRSRKKGCRDGCRRHRPGRRAFYGGNGEAR